MKLKHQLEKVQEFLESDSHMHKVNEEDLKVLLHKLKDKERQLINKVRYITDDDKHKRLRRDIAMLHAQRKKGILVLRALKEKKRQKPSS